MPSPSGRTNNSRTGYVNPSSHYTLGYYRHDGTYVRGYQATNPNSTGADNYSTKGNVNRGLVSQELVTRLNETIQRDSAIYAVLRGYTVRAGRREEGYL